MAASMAHTTAADGTKGNTPPAAAITELRDRFSMAGWTLACIAAELALLEAAGLRLLQPIYGADTVAKYYSLAVYLFAIAGLYLTWPYARHARTTTLTYRGLRLAAVPIILQVALFALQHYQRDDIDLLAWVNDDLKPDQVDSVELYISMTILLIPYTLARTLTANNTLSLASKRMVFLGHLLALTQTRFAVRLHDYVPQLDGLSICLFLTLLNTARLMQRRTFARLLVAHLIVSGTIGLNRYQPWLSCPSYLDKLGICRPSRGPCSVLPSTRSTTGRIAVMEVPNKYRVLMADHSLLGGEWRTTPGKDISIFMTFYMQTMANRVLTPEYEALARKRGGLEFLQIGLGIGTATKALLQPPPHGIDGARLVNSTGRNWAEFVQTKSVTVIELDPAVVTAAIEHFELPTESDDRLVVVTEDALRAVPRLCAARTKDGAGYDIISHDIFTGGSLAFDLFTHDFFKQLAGCLRPGGVLAVNYVASTHSVNGKRQLLSVINTIESALRDSAGETEASRHCQIFIENGKIEGSDNVVIFCRTPDPAAGESGVVDAESKDFLRPVSGKPKLNIEVARKFMSMWRTTLPALLAAESNSTSTAAGVVVAEGDDVPLLRDPKYDGGRSREWWHEMEAGAAALHRKFLRDHVFTDDDERGIWTAL